MNYVFDVEGDGLQPTVIHCLNYKSDEGQVSLTDYDDMRKFLLSAEVLIGHNIARWDIPQLERLLEIKITAKIVDTLALSWYLDPMRPKHGLESYGVEFGVPKPVVDDWFNQPLEVYVHRCQEDVKINWRVWKRFWRQLNEVYSGTESIWKFLAYLEFKMDCAREQERSGWKLDVQYARESLAKLELEKEEKVQELAAAMPRVPIKATRKPPAKAFKADGTLSASGLQWIDLCESNGLPHTHNEPIEVIKGYDDPNPGSSSQIKDWLYSLGWEPRTHKHIRSKTTNEVKSIPQINKEHGSGICDSIKALYEKEPRLEVLDGLSVLSHRIPMLKGFLNSVDEHGYTKACVQGLTNTLRFKHAVVVNLPKVDRPYGEQIRGALISPSGYELCGSDMASLEDRIKQHFLYEHDPEYVETMNRDDYDPHLTIAVIAGMMTRQQMEYYLLYSVMTDEEKAKNDKGKFSAIKSIRSIAKNANYACQYGARPKRVSLTAGISIAEATKLVDAYWELNWAIEAVAKAQLVKEDSRGQMWLFNPVSKFWYTLRTEKDRFSTLVQGTASFCFDLWVGFIRRDRPQLTGQFHDEVILCVKEGYREQITAFLQECIKKTNDVLKLNRELGVDVQYGKRYSEIH